MLQPCIYNAICQSIMVMWSLGPYGAYILWKGSIIWSKSGSLQHGFMLEMEFVKGGHLFSLVYFSHTLLELWSTWRCSWCASYYVMIVGFFDLMFWAERLIDVAAMWLLWRVLIDAHVHIVTHTWCGSWLLLCYCSLMLVVVASCWHIVAYC